MIFKRSYLPTDTLSRLVWLEQFAGKIQQYAVPFGITAAEITIVNNDVTVLRAAIKDSNSLENEMKKRTAFKNTLIHGAPTDVLGPYPTLAALTAPAVSSAAGIFSRNDKLVNRIKINPNYTIAIGRDLGIEPLTNPGLMEATLAISPEISGYLDGNHPVLRFANLNRRNVDIYVERNEGVGFEYLVTTNYATYTDMCTLPQEANYVHWKYKAIYRDKNGQYGEFSKTIGLSIIREIKN